MSDNVPVKKPKKQHNQLNKSYQIGHFSNLHNNWLYWALNRHSAAARDVERGKQREGARPPRLRSRYTKGFKSVWSGNLLYRHIFGLKDVILTFFVDTFF